MSWEVSYHPISESQINEWYFNALGNQNLVNELSKKNKLGLLEVVEPNPIDLNSSSCYSNLFNCDPEGALLYQETAMKQIAEIEKKEGLEARTISSKADYKITNYKPVEKKEKREFWKKLFGK